MSKDGDSGVRVTSHWKWEKHPLTFCLVLQMFSTSVMRAVLRWCKAFSSSSNVWLISVTAWFFRSVSCFEISFTSSMAAVSWGNLPKQNKVSDLVIFLNPAIYLSVPVAHGVQLVFQDWFVLFQNISKRNRHVFPVFSFCALQTHRRFTWLAVKLHHLQVVPGSNIPQTCINMLLNLSWSCVWKLDICNVSSVICVTQHPHLAFVVGAGEGLTCRGRTRRLQNVTSFRSAAPRVSLQHLHQICYEEVVLQCCHALFRQDGGLSTYWAGQSQRLGRDVVLQTPTHRDKGKTYITKWITISTRHKWFQCELS